MFLYLILSSYFFALTGVNGLQLRRSPVLVDGELPPQYDGTHVRSVETNSQDGSLQQAEINSELNRRFNEDETLRGTFEEHERVKNMLHQDAQVYGSPPGRVNEPQNDPGEVNEPPNDPGSVHLPNPHVRLNQVLLPKLMGDVEEKSENPLKLIN